MTFVVLDTETTGLSFFQGDRLIEIGACKYQNRALVDEYHVYINPMCPVNPGALKVHGLSDQFLSDKPLFGEIAQGFLEFISDSTLVIHNASFDVGFLDNELQESGFSKITGFNAIVDTLPMARKMYPGQRNNLDALCKRLGVDAGSRIKHGALLDAKLLSEVYLAMTTKQHTISIGSVKLSGSANHTAELQTENFLIEPKADELAQHVGFISGFELDLVW